MSARLELRERSDLFGPGKIFNPTTEGQAWPFKVLPCEPLGPRRVAVSADLGVVHEAPVSHSPRPEASGEAGVLKQRPSPFNNFSHGPLTYGICLVSSHGSLPLWDSPVLESFNELLCGICPRILNTTFPQELNEGAVGVIRVLREERETILVVGTSIKDD